MSTISNTAVRRTNGASGPLAAAGAAIKRWWVAYITWRIEEQAIAHLKSMSDRELRDIGLSRSQIDVAVRGEVDSERRMITYL